jgi:SAM-dependent methyltransferase
MILFRRARNALALLCRLDFQELLLRLKMSFGGIDLGNVSTEELQLSPERSSYYSNSGGAQLDSVLATFKISSRDAIVDFGCGKGGALITLAKYPFSRILGVEISEELAGIARRNFRKLNIENVGLSVCDATEFSDLDGFNYVYFFNPFPGAVMREVMANINESLARAPRKMTIIYLNPACHDCILENSPFRKLGEFPHHLHRYYIYSNEV